MSAKASRPSYVDFDRSAYAWKPDIDYRKHPDAYCVGKGEQGVLIVEPYKSEMTPHWRFRTPDIAQASADTLFAMFHAYLKNDDFVGADMARKFLQMGYTRARRYANYKGGRKYDADRGHAQKERGTGDPQKAESASIFYGLWRTAEADPDYAARKVAWKAQYG